ncbi:MAG TPA: hypothetical protein VI729_00200 [Anaerolineales bacterium]|nr:hypothetical protein [Anaerolineales bacterium]
MAFENIGVRAVIEGIGAFNRDADAINRRLKEVTGNVDRVGKQSQKTSASLKDFSGTLRATGIGLGLVGAAGTALIVSSTRLAARVETLGVVTATLGRNVGKTEKEIRDLEKAVKAQGITLQATRASIAKMVESNVDLAHATELARLAQDAAVIANINSSEAFERVIDVIASGNVLIARNLGLQVSFERAYQQTAVALGKTTAELTEQERVQARTNAVLAAGTNIVGTYEAAMTTAGKKVLSLDRHLEESSRIIGELFLPAYAEAVDVVTEFLEKFEDATVAQQRGVAATLASASAIATLSGATLIFLSNLPRLIEGLQKIGIVSATAAGAIGLVVTALAALAIAGAKARAENAALRDELQRIASEVINQKGTFRDYENAIVDAAKGTTLWEFAARQARSSGESQREAVLRLLRAQGSLDEQQLESIRVATLYDDKLRGLPGALADTGEAADGAAGGIDDLAAAQEEATRKTQELADAQEILQGRLDEVQLQISTDITPQFGDFKQQLEDLNAEIASLEAEKLEAVASLEVEGIEDAEEAADRIADLNEQRRDAVQRLQELETELEIARLREEELNEETSEASRLQAQARLDRLTADIADQREEISGLTREISEAGTVTGEISADQQEKLSELEAEYAEREGSIRDQIEETTKAWQRQTKEIIFNLATQRLGLGGFTDEELDLLTTLAGPEGLGLVDEAGVALLESLDNLNKALAAPGDQVPDVTAAMSAIAQAMADPAQSADDLVARIEAIGTAFSTLQLQLGMGLAGGPLGITPGGLIQQPGFITPMGAQQFGGPVGRGRPERVGERGEELFIPRSSGEIVSNRLLSVLNSLASALPIAAPPLAMAAAGEGSTTTNNSMTINTSAPVEPIAADFNLLALMGERRG